MCYTKFWKHPKCGCWSVELIIPCKKGLDFSNCPTFDDGIARNPKNHPKGAADEGQCPKHDKMNDYDGDKIRVVNCIQTGYRFGLGPNERDFGIDFLSTKGVSKEKRKKEMKQEGCCTVM